MSRPTRSDTDHDHPARTPRSDEPAFTAPTDDDPDVVTVVRAALEAVRDY
ncbi:MULTISPECIES: hypothetical protein [Nocardia]|nr:MULTISPECIES: hypothetical protein [Nocardia]